MKTTAMTRWNRREGSSLVVVMIMLVIAGGIVGATLSSTNNYARNSLRIHERDSAAFLADAGLQAAVVKLNDSSDGNITYTESRRYFSNTNAFYASDWGFQTVATVVNAAYCNVESTGRFRGQEVVVRSGVTLGQGARSIHALYAHAIFAGNSGGSTNYVLKAGGTGTGADFVWGDVYSGWDVEVSGDALLRLPEILVDTNNDRIANLGETWTNAFALQVFSNALTKAEFDAYKASVAAYTNKFYKNGKYDFGEAYVDTIGNGHYDVGEPFTDLNGNGKWDAGDSFIDRNGNGVYNAGIDTVVDKGNGQWDAGEEWTEDNDATRKTYRVNGKYDPAGGYWKLSGGTYSWKTSYTKSGKTYSCAAWPAEAFVDAGDGVYQPAEPYIDQNGQYDEGEEYLDDRNTIYDYGTQARHSASGMPTPGPGQRAATGGDYAINPPDLGAMYYNLSKTSTQPSDALSRWGYDVAISANTFTTNGGNGTAITSTNDPAHIFVRNPPTSGSVTKGGKTINGRTYSKVYTTNSVAVDDYFLEDPADTTYNSTDSSRRIAEDSSTTDPMLINVTTSGNDKLYYVDGNVYLHSPSAYCFQFRNPGTRITIVAKGNITISDEFYYNADYATNLTSADVNSTIVSNPKDALCFIALKNPACTNSGNILIGDKQFGTGGSIHAMLYAENDFVDNNLDTTGQPFISVFGNMTAGNQVRINRSTAVGHIRTRLDVTLDDRIRAGEIVAPGLPHPVGVERGITVDTAWHRASGDWSSWSRLQ